MTDASGWRRLGVRGRLVVLATAVLALALVAAALLLLVVVRAALVGSLDDAGRQRAGDVAALVETGRLPDPLPVTGSAVVQVVDAQRRVLASSPGGDRLAPILDAAGVEEVRSGAAVVVDGSRVGSADPLRVVGVGSGPDGSQTVLVATSTAEVDRALGVLRLVTGVGTPLLLAGMALLTWRVAGSALRPVEELRRGAEQISGVPRRPGDGRALPVPPSHDEVAALAVTLNAMLGRLDDASDRQRAFLADAAHELRSPLGSVRAQLEVAAARPGDQDWAAVAAGALADVDRMTALVADLLVLARLDGASPSRDTLDLADLVRDNVADGSWRVPVSVEGVAALPVVGDATALGRVLTNLLANATRHARSRVVVRLSASDGEAVVDVVDDGPGIDAADRERVFERFTRLDTARSRDEGGTGLGLAIVRTALRQHGGSVDVLDGDGGSGARLRVRLPLGVSRPRPDGPP
ncbi:MAG TPA: ATP-binding protein [Actinomycetales bacterium]|nr:ATP-binding protein [Actinomycetales bacterium]